MHLGSIISSVIRVEVHRDNKWVLLGNLSSDSQKFRNPTRRGMETIYFEPSGEHVTDIIRFSPQTDPDKISEALGKIGMVPNELSHRTLHKGESEIIEANSREITKCSVLRFTQL